MIPKTFAEIGKAIYDQRPKKTTGIYIGSSIIRYGYRTNRTKMPTNFVTFEELLKAEEEANGKK